MSDEQLQFTQEAQRTAEFSPDRRYRYSLTRRWDHGTDHIAPRPPLIIIGLNPSTADESRDDPTIRRCWNFALREGCGALIMLNLFGFRATNPAKLYEADDPVGPDNDSVVHRIVFQERQATIVAAWGAHADRVSPTRARYFAEHVPNLRCFGVTMYGAPRHPLYLAGDTPLVPYVVR